ncbi:MAG: type II secretion system major pseudopilin GspG [Myxococcota bacterium]
MTGGTQMMRRDRRRAARTRRGFTLIEIMAVVIIMGLLAGIVGVAIFGQLDTARVNTTRTQMKQLESALAFYQMDNGRFPTTEQGLNALIEQPTIGPEPRNFRPGGYLQGGELPGDAWGNDFQYEFPGTNNVESFDLWSLGKDGQPGGNETDADIGNWTEGEEA